VATRFAKTLIARGWLCFLSVLWHTVATDVAIAFALIIEALTLTYICEGWRHGRSHKHYHECSGSNNLDEPYQCTSPPFPCFNDDNCEKGC
jgi:hypothetical protein